ARTLRPVHPDRARGVHSSPDLRRRRYELAVRLGTDRGGQLHRRRLPVVALLRPRRRGGYRPVVHQRRRGSRAQPRLGIRAPRSLGRHRHRERGDRVRHHGGIGARAVRGGPLGHVRRYLPLPARHQRHPARHAHLAPRKRSGPTPRRRHPRRRARASGRLFKPACARRAPGADTGRTDGLRGLAPRPSPGSAREGIVRAL
ncbi:MAG: hypothetical protein AVDCRST_MAG80-1456, partial [uncultured Rubrobacteraceae bacterium]